MLLLLFATLLLSPAPSTAQTGAQKPEDARKEEARKKKDEARKNLKPEPLGLFPLQVAWVQSLPAIPAVPPAYDDTTAYVPLKSGALLAVGIQDGVTRWTVDNVKVGWTPTVDSGRLILVVEKEKKDEKEVEPRVQTSLEARDAATGQVSWQLETAGAVSAQPVARAGWLIVATDNGEVVALRADSGEGIWKLTLNGVVKTAPLIVGDRLYLAPDASPLMAIDIMTGKTVWERDLGGTVNSLSAHGDRVCVGTASRMFFALEEKRGRIEWKWRIGGDVIGRPAFDDDTVYVLNMDNTLRAFELHDGGQRWREALPYRPLSGPIRIEGTVLVSSFTPVLRGYNTKDGKPNGRFSLPIGESSAPAAPPQFIARPSFVDDLFITPALDGQFIAVRRQTSPPVVPLTTLPGTVVPAPTPDATASPSAVPVATPPVPVASAPPKPPAGSGPVL